MHGDQDIPAQKQAHLVQDQAISFPAWVVQNYQHPVVEDIGLGPLSVMRDIFHCQGMMERHVLENTGESTSFTKHPAAATAIFVIKLAR